MVSLTIVLKRHLKRVHQLNDLRCQAFDPADTGRGPERPAMRIADGVRLDVARLRALKHEWEVTVAEPSHELVASAVVRGRKGGKKAAPKGATPAPSALSGKPLAVAQYMWLREMMNEDEDECDFNLLTSVPTTKTKTPAAPRARKRPASGSGVSPKPKRGGKAAGARKKNGKKAYKYCDDSSDEEPSEHESDFMDDE